MGWIENFQMNLPNMVNDHLRWYTYNYLAFKYYI